MSEQIADTVAAEKRCWCGKRRPVNGWWKGRRGVYCSAIHRWIGGY
jgi:hypothetical protein